MKSTHEIFMQRCIELAIKATGKTYPNPLVGSIIVHNNIIIGEGFHQKVGENHAEINAINSVQNKELLKDSTIYVTLEPCSHFGKTPSCAIKLIEYGFKKVVIGSLDPHHLVAGNGIKILKNEGVEVIYGILEKECIAINHRYFTYHLKKRPYIILKWAESNDGFLDQNFLPVEITYETTSQMVHLCRNNEHAILVGSTTALRDNPSLNVRNIIGRDPVKILLDSQLKVPKDFNIYNKNAQIIVFNSIKDVTEDHIIYIKIDHKTDILAQILNQLYLKEIQSVLIEGGSFTHQQFINQNLWDEMVIFKNTKLNLKHGTRAPKVHLTKENLTVYNEINVFNIKNNNLT